MLADLATQPQRAQVEEVAYHLMRSQGTAYALFLQRIIYETSTRPIADKLPMAIGINEAGYIRMRVHWPTFNPLALEVKCELVKHALLKIIMGHFSSRRQKAIDKYGEDIYGMASDIVCNNFMNGDGHGPGGGPILGGVVVCQKPDLLDGVDVRLNSDVAVPEHDLPR